MSDPVGHLIELVSEYEAGLEQLRAEAKIKLGTAFRQALGALQAERFPAHRVEFGVHRQTAYVDLVREPDDPAAEVEQRIRVTATESYAPGAADSVHASWRRNAAVVEPDRRERMEQLLAPVKTLVGSAQDILEGIGIEFEGFALEPRAARPGDE